MNPKSPASSLTTFLQLFLIVLGASFFLGACTPKEKNKVDGQSKIKIVTTTGMIKDAVENIVGDRAEVTALMGPGVDPHLYKATQGDLQKLTDADVVFYNGLHLEGKMGEVLEKLGRLKPVVAVASEIPDSLLRAVPGFQGTHDPHIWFDVHLWENAVRSISHFMQKHDTAHATTYNDRGNRYIHQLDSLHEAVKVSIATIPEKQRVLITAHDAFGYFGDAYKIEVRGLQGISTVSEFGLRDVTELVNFIISRQIKAIFVETSVSQKSIEAVVQGCHQKNWNVKIGGSLYSDAMGRAGTPQGTYIGMVSANVKIIVESLK
jgi:manganese/zinc/iron transport system substrate-binding protein